MGGRSELVGVRGSRGSNCKWKRGVEREGQVRERSLEAVSGSNLDHMERVLERE